MNSQFIGSSSQEIDRSLSVGVIELARESAASILLLGKEAVRHVVYSHRATPTDTHIYISSSEANGYILPQQAETIHGDKQ